MGLWSFAGNGSVDSCGVLVAVVDVVLGWVLVQIPLIIEPDPDDSDSVILCVDGEFLGRSSRFILDTGAARSQVVVDEHASALMQRQSGTSTGVFGSVQSSVLVLPELRVGAAIASDLEVDVVSPTHPCPRNLLGMDVLKFHSLELDLDQGLITLDEPEPRNERLPLQVSAHSHPLVEVHWGDTVARAIWDTGAGMTIVSQDFWTAHTGLFTPAGTTIGTDANGRQQPTPTFITQRCDIGGHQFEPHRVAIVDLSQMGATGIDLIVGYTTIRQAHWYFNFPARIWAVSRRRASRQTE